MNGDVILHIDTIHLVTIGLFFSAAKANWAFFLYAFSSPHPQHTYFSKDKIKGRLEEEMILKLIRALVVLNIYPSVYSMFSYA